MSAEKTIFHKYNPKRKINLRATQIIALVFFGIILIGTLLLMLPVSSRNGESQGFLTSLFTATSATCVTGLSMGDTWSMWSVFGQVVILCMIEIGGLGFMSAASVVLFAFRKKIGLRQRMVMAQSMSLNDFSDVIRLQKWVLLGSLIIQLTGIGILTFRFWTLDFTFGQSLGWGVFHGISAFCNAGFDIFGSINPGQSVTLFREDPVILITLMGLVIVGGLGFFVWEEVATVRRFRRFNIYTKLVVLTTLALIFVGAVLFLIFEWNNPATIGNMSPGNKILNGFFQSVSLRTAGFASVDQGMLTDASKALSIVLMLIGGCSGSTAGGLKTVTFVVLLLFVWSRARGKSTVTVFRRTVPSGKILDAMTIAMIMLILSFLGAIMISVTAGVGFTDSLYETASALGTVGLTTGITGTLPVVAKILLIVFMYFGRVGVLTISLGFLMGGKAEERIRYADTNLLIG